ncbi:MAG TPA: AMP-binding protein [Solirubrobacteraceae bacterium]|nr:AMP-binding protein [Solirubrobacteraceae bacterium]
MRPTVEALRRQLAYLADRSPFYRGRLGDLPGKLRSLGDLRAVPYTTKEELRAGQEREPPFGVHLCAPRDVLVRLHVTSGTTGAPVAIGLTRSDHERNCAIGGAAFRIAGVGPDDVIAHCLNYALYAGGIADHMALERSGATVVPVGVGQSERLLELIPQLGITAVFGTLSYPSHLARRARALGIDPRALNLRLLVTAGEPGAGLAAVRREIEDAWGAHVADTFGMSDVWSTMAGECEAGRGLHVTTGDGALLELCHPDTAEPVDLEDGASGELVWTHLHREASPLLRYRSADLARVWTQPCACGRRGPRLRIDGRRDDMLRVRGANVHPQAVGAVLGARTVFGRYAVVADGDPVTPPLRVVVEAPTAAPADRKGAEQELRRRLGAAVALTTVPDGTLPVAEHKTRLVYRPAHGDDLPPALAAALGPKEPER